ncbi:unnamed protein product [Trypanosoma congolense IL3000]|uniref:WGS project CAEQ00000000 data, annotated contig 487 n=1 Tax=Trypanosoma congolense (strain IL3000) TaxID=1068625 RepID=F9WGB9_TRYCI|nr:unnamed protein product [Trypanosoma congolense IL3000]
MVQKLRHYQVEGKEIASPTGKCSYLQGHDIGNTLVRLMQELLEHRPEDHLLFMERWFRHYRLEGKEIASPKGTAHQSSSGTLDEATGAGEGEESQEANSPPGFAFFSPVHDPSSKTAQASVNCSVDGASGSEKPSLLVPGSKSSSTAPNAKVCYEPLFVISTSCGSAALSMWSPPPNSEGLQGPNVPDNAWGVLNTQAAAGRVPFLKKLIEKVLELPPYDYSTAMALLEGLISKNVTTPALKTMEAAEGSVVDNRCGDNVAMPENGGLCSIPSAPSRVSDSVPRDGAADPSYLQKLVSDALTSSIVAGEKTEKVVGDPPPKARDPFPRKRSRRVTYRSMESFCDPSEMEKIPKSGISSRLPGLRGSFTESSLTAMCEEDTFAERGSLRLDRKHLSKFSSNSTEELETLLRSSGTQEDELCALREACLSSELFAGFNPGDVEIYIRHAQRLTLAGGSLCTCKDSVIFIFSGMLQLEGNEGVIEHFPARRVIDSHHYEQHDGAKEPRELRATTDTVLIVLRNEVLHMIRNNREDVWEMMVVLYLSQSKLFSKVSQRLLKYMAAHMQLETVKAGSVLFTRGQPAEWLSVVIGGTVKRKTSEEEGPSDGLTAGGQRNPGIAPRQLPVGLELGELEVLFNSPVLTDSIATSDVTMLRIHTALFHTIVPYEVVDIVRHNVVSMEPTAQLLAIAPAELRNAVELFRDGCLRIPHYADTHESKRGSVVSTTGITHRGSLLSNRRLTGDFFYHWYTPQNFSSSGEIVYSGKKNLYRFAIAALGLENVVMIAVVSDGTVIRWNDAAERITGFSRPHVIGQSIYHALSTDSSRRLLRDRLDSVRRFAGRWRDYLDHDLSKPQAYSFRQNSGPCSVGLLLSVVPSSVGSCKDVLLIVGHEADPRNITSYVKDTTRWLSDVLRPQLSAFQTRVEEFERKKWNITPEEGATLKGYLVACNQIMESQMRLANLNLESVALSWKAVRIQHVLRDFIQETMAEIEANGNRIAVNFKNAPKGEIFLHVENLLAILRRVVSDVNAAGARRQINITTEVAAPSNDRDQSFSLLQESAIAFDGSSLTAGCDQPGGGTSSGCPASPTVSADAGNVFQSAIPCNGGVRLRSAPSNLKRMSSAGYMRPICITLTVSQMESGSSLEGKGADDAKPFTEHSQENCTTSTPNCEALTKEYEQLALVMGGIFFIEKDIWDDASYSFTLVFPLLPTPWCGEDEDENASIPSITSRQLHVILADGNARQASYLNSLICSRRHIVVQVNSLRDVLSSINCRAADIIFVDPTHLEMTDEEKEALERGEPLFESIKTRNDLIISIYCDTFDGWLARTLAECCHVINVTKSVSAALLHCVFHEMEHMISRLREREEYLARISSAFVKYQPDRYDTLRVLGKGTFGEVYEVEDKLTNGRLAVKLMRLRDGVLASDIARELIAATTMRHNNIIHYFYCQREDDSTVRLYMELASGGTLKEEIRRHGGPLPLSLAVRYLKDLCRGLEYIHSLNFVHGDIKTENSLLDKYKCVKIGDFGTAKQIKRKDAKLYELGGTPQCMAPEMLAIDASEGKGYDQKADIWSLGCVAWELVTGKPLFCDAEKASGISIFQYVSNLKDTPNLLALEDIDPAVHSFVLACLQVDPQKRATAKELLSHGLFHTAWNQLDEMVEEKVKDADVLSTYGAVESYSDYSVEDADDDDVVSNDSEVLPVELMGRMGVGPFMTLNEPFEKDSAAANRHNTNTTGAAFSARNNEFNTGSYKSPPSSDGTPFTSICSPVVDNR